jgi:hypothetical protein
VDSLTIDGIEYRVYDHLYAVSKCGKFIKLTTYAPYTPNKHPLGYLTVGRQRLAHRMVATAWLDRPEGANHVHHINHDKQDNRAENLEWVTPKQHMSEKHEGMTAGHSMSAEGKQSLRDYRTGRKTSEATKQKQREATLRLGLKPPARALGTKLSEESIAKCRANNHMNTSCVINGIKYASFSEAGRALNEKPHSLRKRCLSKNFPNYQLG